MNFPSTLTATAMDHSAVPLLITTTGRKQVDHQTAARWQRQDRAFCTGMRSINDSFCSGISLFM
ncbi:hypothetical protein INR49_018452 [Caranx melampygus]|nr:hypothetical protein INR49_018452 [Caranx melampygus]